MQTDSHLAFRSMLNIVMTCHQLRDVFRKKCYHLLLPKLLNVQKVTLLVVLVKTTKNIN